MKTLEPGDPFGKAPCGLSNVTQINLTKRASTHSDKTIIQNDIKFL